MEVNSLNGHKVNLNHRDWRQFEKKIKRLTSSIPIEFAQNFKGLNERHKTHWQRWEYQSHNFYQTLCLSVPS